jgi:uncharacterized protein YyaL (SSP411 family)
VKSKNRLKNEKSPYLLQHATNPVDWYPWCDAAFNQAKLLDKPVFLSIGYSTCHWCHVMAKEVFEDYETAQLINENFIPIKVDREERKDIDNIYMLACQIMTQNGGWPLTIFTTPEKKPFFAGTYIPKERLKELILQVNNLWKLKRNVVSKTVEKIMSIFQAIENPALSKKWELNDEIINFCYETLYNEFDLRNGGFGKAPKFPVTPNIRFLLNYYLKTKNEKSLGMALKTLESIKLGGIYDQIDGGIHRYSIDEKWFTPHFEKTLYDQALISEMFFKAYNITKDEFYLNSGIDILEYVKENLLSEEGSFYSGEDALIDFYLWEYSEIPEEIKTTLKIEKNGNFIDEKTGERTGKNVLAISNRDDLKKFLKSREKLKDLRKKRKSPEVDRKILTDWNSLMSISFIAAFRVTGDEKYLKIAENNLNFIWDKLFQNNKLYHRIIDNNVNINGYIDDYIFFIDALYSMYETTQNKKYLDNAEKLLNLSIKYFWDNKKGAFFYTPSFSEVVLIRKKEFYDTVIPSGNSRGYKILKKFDKNLAEKLIDIYSCLIPSQPTIYMEFLSNLIEGE